MEKSDKIVYRGIKSREGNIMEFKQLLEEENAIIVIDTNVLLNIYRYSPEFSEFALNCLRTVKNHIVLPATVRLEYGKHCRSEFAKMRERFKNAGKGTNEQIQKAKIKILATCDNLERLQFPDVEELCSGLSRKIEELQEVLNSFFDERSSLDLISHFWEDKDYLMNLVEEWDKSDRIMLSPSQEDIYRWCEEGEKRYKKDIPPGFKDKKNKDGVRKYSDLILWKEILRFAIKEKKPVLFVTDDVKSDWWEVIDGNKHLHEKLINEFAKTGQELFPFNSNDFYNEIAIAYNIEKTDAVEIALRMTDSDYCMKIADKVFGEVERELIYNITDYVDASSAHIGSEGIDELENIEYEFLSAARMDRDCDIITYQFQYRVIAEGTSYEYWGRDDDTKEVITSYGTDHVFEGIITIEVTREANVYLDFEDDSNFEMVNIVCSDLQETEYHERWEEAGPGVFGFCPECGCPLNIDNDGGNGFCVECAPNH